MKKNLLYIIIGLSCWSCNNDNENMAPPFTPQKETRAITYDYPDKDQMLRINLIVENMRMAGILQKKWLRTSKGGKLDSTFTALKFQTMNSTILLGTSNLALLWPRKMKSLFYIIEIQPTIIIADFSILTHLLRMFLSTTPDLSVLPELTNPWRGIPRFIVQDSYTIMLRQSPPGMTLIYIQ